MCVDSKTISLLLHSCVMNLFTFVGVDVIRMCVSHFTTTVSIGTVYIFLYDFPFLRFVDRNRVLMTSTFWWGGGGGDRRW